MLNQYTINAKGLIVSVGKDWDERALRCGAEKAMSEFVVGRPWWKFVSGGGTKHYLDTIFLACRMDNVGFSAICRCDTSNRRMDQKFRVDPQEDETLVVSLEDVPAGTLLHEGCSFGYPGWRETRRCLMCSSFLLGENWIDPLKGPDPRYFSSGRDVCPKCRARLPRYIH